MACHAFIKSPRRCADMCAVTCLFSFAYTICGVKNFECASNTFSNYYTLPGITLFSASHLTILMRPYPPRLARVLLRSAVTLSEHGHPPLRIYEEVPKESRKQLEPPPLEILLKERGIASANCPSDIQVERV